MIEERQGKWERARNVYLILKNYFTHEGMYDVAGEYYHREKIMEGAYYRATKQWRKYLANKLFFLIAGYGERPSHVAICWAVVITLCAGLYYGFNGIVDQDKLDYNPSVLESAYFSIVAFTTLGFGDLVPRPGAFQIVAASEALVGAGLMSIFIFVFARKMIR